MREHKSVSLRAFSLGAVTRHWLSEIDAERIQFLNIRKEGKL